MLAKLGDVILFPAVDGRASPAARSNAGPFMAACTGLGLKSAAVRESHGRQNRRLTITERF